MKTQQRKFVVEIKSKRRSLSQPKSIWGDTDFRALALKAEEDAPHLFKAAEPPQPIATESAQPGLTLNSHEAGAVADVVANGDGDGAFAPSVDRETDQENVSRSIDEKRPISDTPQPQRSKRHAREKPTTKTRSSVIVKMQADPAQPHADPADELAELAAENERLRLLLRARFVDENKRLRDMLARFAG